VFELNYETEFSAAHIIIGHTGKCANLHGHNYKVKVSLKGRNLNNLGFLIDFADLKAITNKVLDKLDHKYINEIDYPEFLLGQTSAENIAKYIYENIKESLPERNMLQKITICETDKYSVVYSDRFYS